ncbi:MAG: hypothetical protein AB9882_15325 [Ignavibacteriaceae bacterium]
MKLRHILVISLSLIVNSFSQDSASSIDSLKKMFNSFEYMKVISYSGKLLLTKDLDEKEKTEILKMKAISHYSLWDEQAAELSFIELLKLNRDYELDSRETSPKIVTFFNNIKDLYLFELYKEIARSDSLKGLQKEEPPKSVVIIHDRNFDYLKSMILPGWGQISSGETTKGWIFSALSSAALISSVYFIIDSNNKENNYLGEINRDLIESRYSEYNSSYKLRNISLALYAALWVYSQLDFYLFPKEGVTQEQFSSFPVNIFMDKNYGARISYTLDF